jgi:hypothetical protein
MSLWSVAFVLCVAAWLAFCAWTARRLLVRSGGAERWGVLWWGVPMWLTMAARKTFDETGGAWLSQAGARELGTALVIGFPIWMWSGHFFGVVMGRVFPQPPERRPGREDRG